MTEKYTITQIYNYKVYENMKLGNNLKNKYTFKMTSQNYSSEVL